MWPNVKPPDIPEEDGDELPRNEYNFYVDMFHMLTLGLLRERYGDSRAFDDAEKRLDERVYTPNDAELGEALEDLFNEDD